LDNLKQTWGGDATELKLIYEPQLQTLRHEIDNVLRDQALQELQLKRNEYDLWQIQNQISILDSDNDINQFNLLKQELDNSNIELQHIKNQLDQYFTDLTKQRNIMENL